MPYISKDRRKALTTIAPQGAGELNYMLTKVLIDYIEFAGLSYATINSIVGALECAKLELYRRVAVPYEDTKISSNGDVYHADVENGNK